MRPKIFGVGRVIITSGIVFIYIWYTFLFLPFLLFSASQLKILSFGLLLCLFFGVYYQNYLRSLFLELCAGIIVVVWIFSIYDTGVYDVVVIWGLPFVWQTL